MGLAEGAREAMQILDKIESYAAVDQVLEELVGSIPEEEVQRRSEAKAFLAERGYDPVFGARPLKRTIQRMIENPLAVEVLAGRFGEGDTIVVEPDGETLKFRKEAHAAVAS